MKSERKEEGENGVPSNSLGEEKKRREEPNSTVFKNAEASGAIGYDGFHERKGEGEGGGNSSCHHRAKEGEKERGGLVGSAQTKRPWSGDFMRNDAYGKKKKKRRGA